MADVGHVEQERTGLINHTGPGGGVGCICLPRLLLPGFTRAAPARNLPGGFQISPGPLWVAPGAEAACDIRHILRLFVCRVGFWE